MARPDGPAPITPIVLISMVALEKARWSFRCNDRSSPALFYTDASLQAPLQVVVA